MAFKSRFSSRDVRKPVRKFKPLCITMIPKIPQLYKRLKIIGVKGAQEPTILYCMYLHSIMWNFKPPSYPLSADLQLKEYLFKTMKPDVKKTQG